MATKRAEPTRRTTILVVLGVSGSGKSTVGAMLAERLGLSFLDADDLHRPQDRAKMAAGHPLTDADRWPWLARIARWMDEQIASGASAVVAGSALKRSYRDHLRDGRPEVRLLYLRGSRDLIASRLAARRGHFFPAELLSSQFDDFEEPAADEHPYVVPLAGSPEQTVARALELLGADGLGASPDG
ncbi:gluconokinase [Kitasatospora sp. NPDC054795]